MGSGFGYLGDVEAEDGVRLSVTQFWGAVDSHTELTVTTPDGEATTADLGRGAVIALATLLSQAEDLEIRPIPAEPVKAHSTEPF